MSDIASNWPAFTMAGPTILRVAGDPLRGGALPRTPFWTALSVNEGKQRLQGKKHEASLKAHLPLGTIRSAP